MNLMEDAVAEKRARIVDKHAAALLDELIANGIDALGVAGGIVINMGSDSACHVFYVMCDDIACASGGPPEPQVFLDDVARSMLQSTATPEKRS